MSNGNKQKSSFDKHKKGLSFQHDVTYFRKQHTRDMVLKIIACSRFKTHKKSVTLESNIV